MEAYGIKFDNRTKTFGFEAGDPALHAGEFMLFAALCSSYGVAQHVRGVEYSTNTEFHDIDVDPQLEHTDIAGAIEVAADASLQQFRLFNRVEFKGGLENDG